MANNEADIEDEKWPPAKPETQGDETPLYQKPVLRKYDQIEQVKPYGPSEREAG